MKNRVRGFALLPFLPFLLAPTIAIGQPSATPPGVAAPSAPVFSKEQLDQMLAPIALYPDELLTQVLIASTYPQELLDAAQWLKDTNNAGLSGDALVAALQPLQWDPSVKSLVAFPQIVTMMTEHLDWTEALGIAFANQQADTMARVQALRLEAATAGSLKSTPQLAVRHQGSVIVIEPAEPDQVYVPVYNPAVVYGDWPYRDRPPVYLPPPPNFYNGPVGREIGFSVAVGIVAPLWRWSRPDWNARRIDIDRQGYAGLTYDRREPPSTVWEHRGPVALVAPSARPPAPPAVERPPGTAASTAVGVPGRAASPPPARPAQGQAPAPATPAPGTAPPSARPQGSAPAAGTAAPSTTPSKPETGQRPERPAERPPGTPPETRVPPREAPPQSTGPQGTAPPARPERQPGPPETREPRREAPPEGTAPQGGTPPQGAAPQPRPERQPGPAETREPRPGTPPQGTPPQGAAPPAAAPQARPVQPPTGPQPGAQQRPPGPPPAGQQPGAQQRPAQKPPAKPGEERREERKDEKGQQQQPQ